jgi:hypothetical protein
LTQIDAWMIDEAGAPKTCRFALPGSAARTFLMRVGRARK